MELDTRGLKCPIPIIRLSAALKTLPVSGELTVLADDRGFPPDVRAWCDKVGHELVSLVESDPARMVAVIRRLK
jgi:tRNA 2-thiouridine synthesizing protein A